MFESNPLVLFNTLNRTLRRYIPTTLPIGRRYPDLQTQFRRLLEEQELVKGPYVEALPDFEKGKALRSLLSTNGGVLHEGFAMLPEDILDRPLHLHQEKAFELACREEKSILVATGTGSGKTECFLFPLAHRLMGSQNPKARGVRCLIIYPMNALANDQLYYRIAPLFGVHLASLGITFGRYTSQIRAKTPRRDEENRLKENEKLMAALGGKIPSNWLLTREEMLENPPQILITNYAMLEHLLLLPRNAPLFDQNALQAIVLDEIHTYTGAQATEVAYLLRKLKTRLKISSPLQVFGTSASLPDGAESDQKICQFASNLFGEVVQSVIRGRRIPHRRLQEKRDDLFNLDIASWITLGQVLNRLVDQGNLTHSAWNFELEEHGLTGRIPKLPEGVDLRKALEGVFSASREIRRISEILDKGGVRLFQNVANDVFPDEPQIQAGEKTSALSAVMHMGMLARREEEGFPLLPGRYHLITNSIEGVSARPDSTQKEGWSALKALRHFSDDQGIYYPMMVCRKCGQPFLEGFECQGTLFNRVPMTDGGVSTRRVFWLGKPAQATADEDDGVEESDAPTDSKQFKVFYIDPKSGGVIDEGSGAVSLHEINTVKDEDDNAYYVRKCPACGGRSGSAEAEIVTRMHPGNEALGAVVAQKVLEALPENHQFDEPRPMGGKGLLTFSDNRQDAAFFAPYFERTSGDLALRTAIFQTLNKIDEPMDLELLGEQVHKFWRRGGQPIMLDEQGQIRSGFQSMRDILLGKIAAEFCTPGGRRNSLEALGLAHVGYDGKKIKQLKMAIKHHLPQSHQEEAESLIRFLLETIRREKAIGNLFDLDMRNEFIWGGPYANHRAFELHKTNPMVTNAWIPKEGSNRHNRRTWYLVEQLGWTWEDARSFLATFWQAMEDVRLLVRLQPGYALDGRSLRFESGSDYPLYVCNSCGLLQTDVVGYKCSAFNCKGQVRELSSEERANAREQNHYIFSYSAGVAQAGRAREHTASLSTDLREQIEREFSEGAVNVLSCTTTMEMGVDLGDLEAVVNLNIPPGISNYQQRTGRAGRRAQAAPCCVTVARNTQYDQAVFREFHDFLKSDAPIPFLLLDNARLFRRHQNGVVLTGFFRYRIENLERNAPGLNDLFGEIFGPTEYQAFLDDLDHWLEGDDGRVWLSESESLAGRLPSDISPNLGLRGGELKAHVRENLRRLAREVFERWKTYTDKVAQAKEKGDNEAALREQLRWTGMRKQYMNQFLVDQISQRSLIPTYSFPVHTLTLEVTKEQRKESHFRPDNDVALSRDAGMGISEYAPGAEVVANGRLWRSDGLAYYPRRFMPVKFYVACPNCHHVDINIDREMVPSECSNCGSTDRRLKRAFIEPKGFVTSYEERLGKDPGMHRRRQKRADEARLITIPGEEQFVDTNHPFVRTALLRALPIEEHLQPGRLFIVNRGAYGLGYFICPLCNHAESGKTLTPVKQKHKEPLTGRVCRNEELKYPQDLAHIFETDVLLLRLSHPIPQPEADEKNPLNYMDNFARTLCEVLRFAAARLLQVQAAELRASFRRTGQYIEVVLYDAIAGGAGYCVGLQQGVSMRAFLEQAADILDCKKDCTTACSACLCDYANQISWDQFDRKPVLGWLQALLGGEIKDPFVKMGATRWERPSLAGLSERLVGVSTIHLAGLDLEGHASNGEVLQWLLKWLNEGKKAWIHLVKPLETNPRKLSATARQTMRHISPWVSSGQLVVGALKNFDEQKLPFLPRVFTGTSAGSVAWYSARPLPCLFEELLPNPVYQYSLDDSLESALRDFEENTHVYSPDRFKESEPIERWEIKEGEKRNLKNYFSIIKGAYIEEINVKDPFCGAGPRQRESLVKFIKFAIENSKSIKGLTIVCREQSLKDPRYQPPYKVKEEIEKMLKLMAENLMIKIFVQPHKSSRSFHDRTIDIDLIDVEGCSVRHRFDLTGGIDFLMDEKAATKIYRYVV